MIYLIVFLLLLIVIYCVIGWHFSTLLIKPKTYDHDYAFTYDLEREKFDNDYWESLTKEPVLIQTKGGYTLNGYWLEQANAKKTVIICHGITWNLVGSIKYLHLFYNRGYNVLIFDNRNHGKSGGHNTTFGHFEKEDLSACCDFVEERMGRGAYIGTHGESLGAASVLQHLAVDTRVKFCVADCPYSDLKKLLDYRLKIDYPAVKIPILPIASLFTKLRAQFSIYEISPLEAIKNIHTPVLFIHGVNDDYIPPYMSEDMYRAKVGKNQLWIAPNAKHAGAYYNNKEAYNEQVGNFLAQLSEE